MSDPLAEALKLLAAESGNAEFEAIVWCPEQHVLSFRRVGGWQWVNLWLHATGDMSHEWETNGGNGWGGTAPVVLWRDGEHVDDERHFVFNVPLRKADGTDVSRDLRDRIAHHTGWPMETVSEQ